MPQIFFKQAGLIGILVIRCAQNDSTASEATPTVFQMAHCWKKKNTVPRYTRETSTLDWTVSRQVDYSGLEDWTAPQMGGLFSSPD